MLLGYYGLSYPNLEEKLFHFDTKVTILVLRVSVFKQPDTWAVAHLPKPLNFGPKLQGLGFTVLGFRKPLNPDRLSANLGRGRT